MEGLPVALLTAGIIQVSCQVFKLVYYSIKDRAINFRYLVSPGGMPSAHSAFVSALSVSVGFRSGWASELFAVSFVFSAIVIFDALRLRGHVQEMTVRLNVLTKGKDKPLSEMVGHSPAELLVGILLGGGLSALAHLIFVQNSL